MTTIKYFFIVSILLNFIYLNRCAPSYKLLLYPTRNTLQAYNPQPRPLGTIGDWIAGSSWLPIEINVPDTISSIVSSISGITGSVSNGISGITGMAQRIPFIHRLTSQETPRPLQYLIVIPNQLKAPKKENSFNPFVAETEDFPHYP